MTHSRAELLFATLFMLCSAAGSTAALAAPPKTDLLQLSDQADQLDKLEFDTALQKADRCTSARNFSCSEAELAKAARLASGAKAKAALSGSRSMLYREREQVAEEIRQAEERRLAEERRIEEERLAQLRYEEEERARERRREQAEEERVAMQERADQQARDSEARESNRSAWADVANQITKRAAENAAILRQADRNIANAMAQSNRIRAEQAAERERAAQRAADQRRDAARDAARDREQRQQAANAREADNARAEQRRAADAAAARERAADAAAAQERSRQRLAAVEQERVERVQRQDDQRQQAARKKADDEAAVRNERRAYLDAMISGVRLVATKCPDGAGHYYATGVLPKSRPKGDMCIDVHYEAVCPGSRAVVTGVAKNFIGMSGCFGDTYQIEPKPACAVTEVQIQVRDVTPGCG